MDVRIPAGQAHGTLLVHASSRTVQVFPETQVIKVPRKEDSETAHFRLKARSPGDGEVSLTIFDEFRLIGSLTVRVRAAQGSKGLILEKSGEDVFRDPAREERVRLWGRTIQVSLSGSGRAPERIKYQLLLPEEKDGVLTPRLRPLGESAAAFNAGYIQSALRQFREQVNGIEAMLDDASPARGVTLDEIQDGLRIELEGAGRQIADDLLSAEVRAYFTASPQEVVHWVIKSPELDAVPWELACNPYSGRFFNETSVLVRVPVREGDVSAPGADKEDGSRETRSRPGGEAPAPANPSLVYVLGEKVVHEDRMTVELDEQLKRIVRGAASRFTVTSNFDKDGRQQVSVSKLKSLLQGAQVLHLLCHGIVEENGEMYLKIEGHKLGRLRPYVVSALHLSPGALVFLNACSSSAASFSVAGLTTFGWEFRKAGAAVCLATLAPVTTKMAIRFATAFFDAHFQEGHPVPEAVLAARRHCADDSDPTWLLYTVYGELSEPAPAP